MAVSSTKLTNSHPKFELISAPQPFANRNRTSVFIAGSIDVGKEVNWQTSVAQSLSHLPVVILDPFRTDWDSSWKEDIAFAPFREQAEWEMEMREAVDVVAIYFGSEAKAPISLLELGLSAQSGKVIVCCAPGYWKRGYVQIICQRFGIELVDTVEEFTKGIESKLKTVKE